MALILYGPVLVVLLLLAVVFAIALYQRRAHRMGKPSLPFARLRRHHH